MKIELRQTDLRIMVKINVGGMDEMFVVRRTPTWFKVGRLDHNGYAIGKHHHCRTLNAALHSAVNRSFVRFESKMKGV